MVSVEAIALSLRIHVICVGQQHSTRDNNGKSVTVMLLQTVPANAWQDIAMDILLGTGQLLGTGRVRSLMPCSVMRSNELPATSVANTCECRPMAVRRVPGSEAACVRLRPHAA
jgi:hypothetical protein